MQSFLQAFCGKLGSAAQYVALHRGLSLICLAGPVTLFVDAPFGRFSSSSKLALNINAKAGWFLMEIVSPLAFVMALLGPQLDQAPLRSWLAPLTLGTPRWSNLFSLSTPTKILALAYVVHYANRSTISLLRMPQSRSPMSIVVFLSGVYFNFCNGNLMGSWLGGRTSPMTMGHGAVPQLAMQSKTFWSGLALWLLGFIGNIISDEILYNLRRPDPSSSDGGRARPRYSIPRGFLYDFPLGGISFPAYFCEWLEWIGFAVAATCCSVAPAFANHLLVASAAGQHGSSTLAGGASSSSAGNVAGDLVDQAQKLTGSMGRSVSPLEALSSPSTFATPPFLFVWAEISTMISRALRGHAWYKDKFKGDFPKDRKAVIPGIL